MIRRRRSVFGVLMGAIVLVPVVSITSGTSAAPAAVAGGRVDLARVQSLRAGLTQVTGGAAHFAERDGTGALSFAGGTPAEPLQPPTGKDSSSAARQFVDGYGPAFGVAAPATDLTESHSFHSSSGDAVRFQQSYRGVPVIGGELAVQLAPSGAVVSSSGKAAVGMTLGVTPAINASAAAAAARSVTAKHDGVDPASLVVDAPALSVYDPTLWGITDPAGQRLVWRTSVHAATGVVNRYVLVDATTGAIALDFSQVEAALNRQVCDQANTRLANPSVCSTAIVRNEADPPIAGNTDLNNAFDFAGLTYTFYLALGRNSIDNAGMPLVSKVKVCLDPLNPSLSACPYANAFWDSGTQQMYYGANYANGADVVGHELTHGVTESESGLLYYGQSGAINESLSDVFGELIDRSRPVGADTTWSLGEDLPGGAIRSMSNPPLFNDPDRMTSVLYSNFPSNDMHWDSGGVHTNSGINNKAAFLIDAGGVFNGQTVVGLGDAKTARIYYLAQTTLLGPLSQYSDLAAILPQACTNLVGQFGIVANDCTQVAKAVTATEMATPPPAVSVTTPTDCVTVGATKGAVLASDDQSSNASWAFTTTNGAVSASFQTPGATANRVVFLPDASVAATTTATWQQSITIPAGETVLAFRNFEGFEATFDGGVVEYSSNGGSTWNDVGTLPNQGSGNNGYDGTLTASALSGRSAFTAAQQLYRTTRFNLSSLAGLTIKLRFKASSDSSVGVAGWAIDDLSVYRCVNGTPPPPYTPLVPARLMETRAGYSTVDGLFNGIGALAAGTVTALTVAGRGGVPVGASSATLNVTVVDARGPGFLTVFPCDAAQPNAASLNYVSKSVVANLVTAKLSATGTVCIFAQGTTDVVVDVGGYFPSGSSLVPLVPSRLLETRAGYSTVDGLQAGIGASGSGSVTEVQVTGRLGIPADATAVLLNVTVVSAQGPGFATVFPCGGTLPLAANLNYLAGQIIPNAVVAKIGAQGRVCIYTQTATDLVVDAGGWFPAVSDLVPLVPARLMDTRPGYPTVDGQFSGIGIRLMGGITALTVAGRGGVPTNAAAVALNVTVAETQLPGFVTVFPCDAALPNAANLNYGVNSVVPNAAIAKVSAQGTVCFYTHTPTQIIVDVNGYFTG